MFLRYSEKEYNFLSFYRSMKTIKDVFIFSILFYNINLSFAQLGKNGALTVSTANTFVNEYTNLTANAVAGSSTIQVGNSLLNSNGVFNSSLSSGDLLMIVQMQGATIKSGVMDSTWGEVLNYNNCGTYEFCEVASIPNSTSITICPLKKDYTASGKTQVIRVPRYTSLTVNNGGVITCVPWDGTIGGIVSVEVSGNVIINTGGSIDVNGKGFRGGTIDSFANVYGDFQVSSFDPLSGGEKGEGIAGYQSDYDIYGGRYSRGAPANAGGGGNAHNSGGGGGANGGNIGAWTGNGNPDVSTPAWINAWNLEYVGFANSISSGGGKGGYTYAKTDNNALILGADTAWQGDYRRNAGGIGGRPLDYSQGRLFLGGGGGAGDQNNECGSAGGSGGGMVYLKVLGNISGSGTISANGNSALSSKGKGIDGLGGGGGGGTIILNAFGVVSGISAIANGGNGGNQLTAEPESEGPGGGGGGGYIGISNGAIFTISSGAKNGTSNSTLLTEFPPNGATQGGNGSRGRIIDSVFSFNVFPDSVCSGSTAILTAKLSGSFPIGAVITWYDENGSVIGTGNSYTTPSLTNTTIYYVGVCPGTYRKPDTAFVFSSPVINVPNATICAGSSTTLTASGANTYTWAPTTGLSSNNGNSVVANPISTATYTVTGTNLKGCTGSTTVVVTVDPSVPLLAIPSGICPGDTTTLTATGALSYNWSPATGLNTTTGSMVKASPKSTTIYTITGLGINGCTVTTNVTVTVFPHAKAEFTVNPTYATTLDPTINFTDHSVNAINWNWTFGDPDDSGSTKQNPSFKYSSKENTTYKIRLIITDKNGCIDTAEEVVSVVEGYTFFIPNTFTPNEDGINDFFSAKGTGIDETDYNLLIFDRWGNLIWQTRTWGETWDGRANNGADVAQIDTYVWKVRVREKYSGIVHNYIGHVNIVK